MREIKPLPEKGEVLLFWKNDELKSRENPAL